MIQKIFISLSMMFFLGLCCVSAQEVTLVTSGEGMTKTEATAAALRSAIEQSFETFVSANTTILNDDIVKDEVATVTSGNIKSYKELSSTKDQQGIYTVSVSATVSLGKLIEYAKSHGSSAEFAGQTFAMNIKMRELNKKNEAEALNNLLLQLKTLQNDLFNYDLKVYESNQTFDGNYDIQLSVSSVSTQNYMNFLGILINTLKALSVSDEDQSAMQKNNQHCTVLQIDNLRVWLRNDSKVVEKFTKSVVDILNSALISFVVQEKGNKTVKLYPKLETFGRFITNGPTSIGFFGKNNKIPVGINKTVGVWDFHVKYTLNEISEVSGFEVKKLPINER